MFENNEQQLYYQQLFFISTHIIHVTKQYTYKLELNIKTLYNIF